jgi:organic radical activating enzyme
MNLKVNEIFYSLQGEGVRQGEASIFIRLSGCDLCCAFCDTDHAAGELMSVDRIGMAIGRYPCRWIVWTGGEPALQLTDSILSFFKGCGYRQAVESNGRHRLSDLLDYTVVSPKGRDTGYARTINRRVDEVRLPVAEGMEIPAIELLPDAGHYCLSPIFTDDDRSTQANIRYCVDYVCEHPAWRLSIQMHKMIGIE